MNTEELITQYKKLDEHCKLFDECAKHQGDDYNRSIVWIARVYDLDAVLKDKVFRAQIKHGDHSISRKLWIQQRIAELEAKK